MSAPHKPVPRLLTAADLAALPDELPSGGVHYELDDGRLVVLPLPTWAVSSASSNVAFSLRLQGQQRGHGKAWGYVGIILRPDPDRVVGPNACFVANDSLPLRVSP